MFDMYGQMMPHMNPTLNHMDPAKQGTATSNTNQDGSSGENENETGQQKGDDFKNLIQFSNPTFLAAFNDAMQTTMNKMFQHKDEDYDDLDESS
jgi:hypothetical protein